jgi:hypothetical protein
MTGAESDNVPNGGSGGGPQEQPAWPGTPPFGGLGASGGHPTQPFGSGPGASGGNPTQPFGGGPVEPPTQPFGGNPWQQQAGQGLTPPPFAGPDAGPGAGPGAGGQFGPPAPQPAEPGAFGAPAPGGWPQGYADYSAPQAGAQFPMQQFPEQQFPGQQFPAQQFPQQPQKTGNGRFVAALVGTLAAVTAVGVTLLLVTGNHSNNSSPIADASLTSTPADASSPTDTSAADAATGDATGTGTDGTATSAAFDSSEMDSASSDPAPFTTDAMLPSTFTDSKGIQYSLQGAGTHSCVQDQMSSDVQSVMRKYGCSQVLTGSYTVDSSTITSNSDILVSVEVFAFKDASTADSVYNSFPQGGSWDFGIWCPKSGNGAKPCSSSSSEYSSATKSESEVNDHRYLVEATALYTNLTTDSSAKAWTDAAVKEAVNSCGPEYYVSNQD